MSISRTELELKLVGPSRDALLLARFFGDGEWERVHSIYYDAPGALLAQSGVTLRILEDAAGRRLGAKRAASGLGACERREIERRLAPGDAQTFITGDAEIDAVIAQARKLAPIADIETSRWSKIITQDGAVFEVSAETGRAILTSQDGAQSPVAEIEIEWLKGDPAPMFDLAAALISRSDGRLRLSLQSKLSRASGAAASAAGEKMKAPPEAADGDLDSIASRSLRKIVRRIIETAPIVADCGDPASVKSLRIALRRYRVWRQTFGPLLAAGKQPPPFASIDEVSPALAPLRDCDVFVEFCRKRESMLAAVAQSERARLASIASLNAGSPEFGHFALDCLALAITAPWRHARIAQNNPRAFARKALDRNWSRVKVKAQQAASEGSISDYHALRKAMRKFRYSAQFFRAIDASDARKAFFKRMAGLQRDLGDIADHAACQKFADRFASGDVERARAAGFVSGYCAVKAECASRLVQPKIDALIDEGDRWLAAAFVK